jgi:hypothetical protein
MTSTGCSPPTPATSTSSAGHAVGATEPGVVHRAFHTGFRFRGTRGRPQHGPRSRTGSGPPTAAAQPERQLCPLADHGMVAPDSQRGVGDEAAAAVEFLLGQPVAGNDAADQPPAVRLLSGDQLARVQQLRGDPARHAPRHQPAADRRLRAPEHGLEDVAAVPAIGIVIGRAAGLSVVVSVVAMSVVVVLVVVVTAVVVTAVVVTAVVLLPLSLQW